MQTLAALRAGYARPGCLDWIGLRPSRRAELQSVAQAELAEAGLTGDHGRAGKRAVTLIQAEYLPVIAALAGHDSIAPETLRRNVVISGLNLQAFRDVPLRIGQAVVQITVPCAPCSRMEAALGPGGYNAMRGHGGWCARVLTPGAIRLGDRVMPQTEAIGPE